MRGYVARRISASTVVSARCGRNGSVTMLPSAIGPVPGLKWKLGARMYVRLGIVINLISINSSSTLGIMMNRTKDDN